MPRLLAANAHRPRGDLGARGLQPGADNAFIHAAQVREPRQEPQHKNAVVPPAVDVDDLLFGQPGVLCHKGQVGAVISAVNTLATSTSRPAAVLLTGAKRPTGGAARGSGYRHRSASPA